jgi:hypothetical protein
MPSKYKEYVVYETTIGNEDDGVNDLYQHPLVYMATGGQDNFYFHEMHKEADKKQFVEAMKKEIDEHNKNGNWAPILRAQLPPGTAVITSVWAMRRKRDLKDGRIHKWKAQLNVDGSKQIKGVNFWETYAPVAQWASIRLILCMVSLNAWKIITFDFVPAFPQAPSVAELYIDIPNGCHVMGTREEWCLKVIKNIYDQKQAGRVWYSYPADILITRLKSTQSRYDPCVLWKDGCILVIYTDDTIIVGPETGGIDIIVSDIESIFKITNSDNVDDFLGVNI